MLLSFLLVLFYDKISPLLMNDIFFYGLGNSSTRPVKFAFSFMQESLLGTDWRNIKGQVLASGNGTRQPSRKQFLESSPSDSKSTEASTSMSVDDLGAIDSASVPSTSRVADVRIKFNKCVLESGSHAKFQ